VGAVIFLEPSFHRQMIIIDDLPLAQEYGPLDRVLQFPPVARPGVQAHLFNRRRGESRHLLLEVDGISIEEKPGEGKDIFPTLPKNRYVQIDHIQAEEEVLPEPSFLYLASKILVGGGHHPTVPLDALPAAPQSLELLLLQDAQDLGLGRRAHVTDLVQENGSLVRLLAPADPELFRPGEGPPLV